jgi:hypothetical protein
MINGRTAIYLVFLLVSIAVNIWLGFTVARLENIRNGIITGTCLDTVRGQDYENPFNREQYELCLEATPSRSFSLSHLFYALGFH